MMFLNWHRKAIQLKNSTVGGSEFVLKLKYGLSGKGEGNTTK